MQKLKELERLKDIYKKFLEEIEAIEGSSAESNHVQVRGTCMEEPLLLDDMYSTSNFVVPTTSTSGRSPQHSMISPVKSHNPWSNYKGGVKARVTEGPGIYYLGVIDMLQEWNFKKKGERFLKTKFLRKDPEGLSAIEPVAY